MMKKMFQKFINSHLLAFTIMLIMGLAIVFFIIAVINNIDNIVGTFCISLSASFVSIIGTVTFVQYYFDVNDECEYKKEEKSNILLIYNYIMAIYAKYKVALYELVTKKVERNSSNFIIKEGFDFHSMSDLFYSSSLLNNGMIEPVVFIFLKCEKELREAMIKLVTTIKFKYYLEIYNIAIEFIVQSILYDQSYAIISDYNTYADGKRKVAHDVMKMINDENIDYVKLFDDKKIGSNIIVPYIMLFKQVNEEMKILNSFFTEIDKL